MTPQANLQNRGKRNLKRGWGSGLGRDCRRFGSPFPPGSPRLAAARQARGTAAAARSPGGGREPVFHPRPTPTSGGYLKMVQPARRSSSSANRAAPTITDAERLPPASCRPGQSAGTLRRRPASCLQVLKATTYFLMLSPVGSGGGAPGFLHSF